MFCSTSESPRFRVWISHSRVYQDENQCSELVKIDELAAAVFINKLIPGYVGVNVSTDSEVIKAKIAGHL